MTDIRPSWDLTHGPLRVSGNNRFLVHEDGTPFFWLGDTAWELFHRLNREDAEIYLETRRRQGFTVIQAVCLAELDGLTAPNAYGRLPLMDNDPARPDTEGADHYWSHVDWIVGRAAEKGLYIGMLPTWGDKIHIAWGGGPEIFTSDNGFTYGKWIGERYGQRPNIIWINGGDRPVEDNAAIHRAIAAGLEAGDGGRNLVTFHSPGASSSSDAWPETEPWLDFNMMQSGHGRKHKDNYAMIERDYALIPAKPVLDGEPCYENHSIDWKPEENGWFDAHDVRQAAYWALFAGAFGHTYGCHDIWQMLGPGREPVGLARGDWRVSIMLPGAIQMGYVRNLMLSRPFLSRIPDQNLIAGGQGDAAGHARATRDSEGRYAMIYAPTGRPLSIDTTRLTGARLQGWWFNPRDGEAFPIGTIEHGSPVAFTPPASGAADDWVLVIDDEAQGFGAPGGQPLIK